MSQTPAIIKVTGSKSALTNLHRHLTSVTGLNESATLQTNNGRVRILTTEEFVPAMRRLAKSCGVTIAEAAFRTGPVTWGGSSVVHRVWNSVHKRSSKTTSCGKQIGPNATYDMANGKDLVVSCPDCLKSSSVERDERMSGNFKESLPTGHGKEVPDGSKAFKYQCYDCKTKYQTNREIPKCPKCKTSGSQDPLDESNYGRNAFGRDADGDDYDASLQAAVDRGDLPDDEEGMGWDTVWKNGDTLRIQKHTSKPGKGLSYNDMVVVASEDGRSGGWDVYDAVGPEGEDVSFYGFSVASIHHGDSAMTEDTANDYRIEGGVIKNPGRYEGDPHWLPGYMDKPETADETIQDVGDLTYDVWRLANEDEPVRSRDANDGDYLVTWVTEQGFAMWKILSPGVYAKFKDEVAAAAQELDEEIVESTAERIHGLLGNRVMDVEFELDDAEGFDGPGDKQDAVDFARSKPYMKAQLAKLSPEDVKADLSEYGAWDDEELLDHEKNLDRVVWLAGSNAIEEHKASHDEQLKDREAMLYRPDGSKI